MGNLGLGSSSVTAACVSLVDQLASPSFSSLICNKLRVMVIPLWAAERSKERTMQMPSFVSDTQLELNREFLFPKPNLNLRFFFPVPC